MMKPMSLKIIATVAICLAIFVFLLGFIPCGADVDARNEYIEDMKKELDLKKNSLPPKGLHITAHADM